MEERITNIIIGILMIAVIANSSISLGLYNQIQGYQVSFNIEELEDQIESLLIQLDDLETGVAYLNESMIEEIQTIKANLTELQQTLDSLNLDEITQQLDEITQQLDLIAQQLEEIQIRIDQIMESTGMRDLSMMDYNLTGTFSNWYVSPCYVVNGTEDGIYLGWSHDITTPIVKGLWKWFLLGLNTPEYDIDPSVIQGNYTIIVLIWSPYRNISTSWNSVDALAVLEDWYDSGEWYNINDTMSVRGVGDVIEMTYSYELNITPPNRSGPFTLLRLNENFPEGEYRIMMALKEVT